MAHRREPSVSYFLFEKLLGDLYMAYLEGRDDASVLREIEDVWAEMSGEDRKVLRRVIGRVNEDVAKWCGDDR